MKNRIVSMKSHLNCIEDQFDECGLSSGIYAEYANDVAIAFAYDLIMKLKDDGVHSMTDQAVYDLLNDGEHVTKYED